MKLSPRFYPGNSRQILYYEAENINDELNKMNETELASAHAQRLMDRLEEIRAAEVHQCICGPLAPSCTCGFKALNEVQS